LGATFVVLLARRRAFCFVRSRVTGLIVCHLLQMMATSPRGRKRLETMVRRTGRTDAFYRGVVALDAAAEDTSVANPS
jgi:hypothetical protein